MEEFMNLANFIDHTLLKPDAKASEIEKLCGQAIEHGFYSVCVHPYYLPLVKQVLQDSLVKTCTVIGFPLGLEQSAAKLFEARHCLDLGADELDMLINISALKDRNYDYVEREIQNIAALVKEKGKLLKVILETCLLSRDEIQKACQIAESSSADFVKTSTGFSRAGASIEDIRLMKASLGPKMGIKASAGIRDRKTALALIDAGATRLGTSASLALLKTK